MQCCDDQHEWRLVSDVVKSDFSSVPFVLSIQVSTMEKWNISRV